MIALAVAHAVQCPYCIDAYANDCLNKGVNPDQILERSGNLDNYMKKSYSSFNVSTLEGLMCHDQISVGYDGRIYDCDFNQAADLPVSTDETIFDLVGQPCRSRKICFGNHCYGCTAGQGSSCGGATEN